MSKPVACRGTKWRRKQVYTVDFKELVKSGFSEFWKKRNGLVSFMCVFIGVLCTLK